MNATRAVFIRHLFFSSIACSILLSTCASSSFLDRMRFGQSRAYFVMLLTLQRSLYGCVRHSSRLAAQLGGRSLGRPERMRSRLRG